MTTVTINTERLVRLQRMVREAQLSTIMNNKPEALKYIDAAYYEIDNILTGEISVEGPRGTKL